MVEEIQGCLDHCADSENTFCRGLEGGKKGRVQIDDCGTCIDGTPWLPREAR